MTSSAQASITSSIFLKYLVRTIMWMSGFRRLAVSIVFKVSSYVEADITMHWLK